jgi:hypothetical protein
MQQLCFASGLSSEQWAAWVQAVGSIAAILAAIGVGWYQARRSEALTLQAARHAEQLLEMQRTDRVSELFAAPLAITSAALHQFQTSFKELLETFSKNEFGSPHGFCQRHDYILAALDEIPAHALPSLASVQGLLKMRDLANETVKVLNSAANCVDSFESPTAQKEIFDTLMAELADEYNRLSLEAVRVASPPPQ